MAVAVGWPHAARVWQAAIIICCRMVWPTLRAMQTASSGGPQRYRSSHSCSALTTSYSETAGDSRHCACVRTRWAHGTDFDDHGPPRARAALAWPLACADTVGGARACRLRAPIGRLRPRSRRTACVRFGAVRPGPCVRRPGMHELLAGPGVLAPPEGTTARFRWAVLHPLHARR